MLVLAIDTATPFLVLGLPQAERTLRLERRHAEALWPELEEFLGDNGVARGQLEAIAVGEGPGSYTGLRVGVAAGLGLGRGLGVPVVGVNTLEGVALRYSGTVTVAHTTRNGLCYSASYAVDGDNLKETTAPERKKLNELEQLGLLVLDEPPSGRVLSRLGQLKIEKGQIAVTPQYL